jgi:hypothetical protein
VSYLILFSDTAFGQSLATRAPRFEALNAIAVSSVVVTMEGVGKRPMADSRSISDIS